MAKLKYAGLSMLVVMLMNAGCATSPQDESRRQAIEADIADILAQPLDPAVYGETKRCLNETEYRNYRALDSRRILFEGRHDKLWINSLRTNCPDLRDGDVLVIRSLSARRICDADSFAVADWFDWPWYRRWPWQWGRWGTGMTCAFGQFQPVSAGQLAEIEELLEAH